MSESNENLSVCQHCGESVHWGSVWVGPRAHQHRFFGFVHDINDLPECPEFVYVVKQAMESEGEDLCGQVFRTVEKAWDTVAEIVADFVRDEMILTHSDETGCSFRCDPFEYDTAWVVVERLPLV